MSVGAIRAGRAYVELSADNQKLIAALKRAEESVARFGAKASELGAQFATLGVATAAPLAFAVQNFAAFDDQMRAVQAVSGSTGAEFEALTAKARELGRTTSFTAEQVASGMVELGRAGFKAPQIDAAIASAMDLSRSTQTEIPLATEIAGNALRAFDLEASEMGRVCDVLTATANNSSQTLEDLGEAFKFVAPIAKDAGTSIEDAAKIVGTLANFGIKGSLAGTAFKNIQLKMTDPDVQKRYKELGVDVVDADDGSLRNMADVLRELGAATASMPNAEKLATYKDLFSMYGLSGGVKLTSANFTGMYDAIDNSQGTAAETAAAMDTGIGGAFRLTESALEGVKHALGDALTPTLKELADEIQRVAGTTSAWIAENKETVVWIAKAAAVATVAGGSMLALGQGAKMASSTFSALRTVGQGYVGVLNALTGSSNAATRAARAREIAQKKLAVETKAQAQLDRAYAAETKANAAARALGLKLTKAETAAAKARFVGERLSLEAQADSIRGAYNLAAAKRQEATHARIAATATLQNAREAANSAVQMSRAAAGGALLRRSFAMLAASLGPMLAIGAVTYAITQFGEASARAANAARKESDAAAEQARANAELRSEHEQMFERLKELSEKSELTNAEFAEGAEIANQLQTAYGDLGITIDATAKKFGGLTEAARKFKEAQIEQEIRDKQAQYAKLGNEDKAISREFKALQGSGGFWKGVGSWFGGQSLDDRHAALSDRRGEIRTEQTNLANDVALLQAQLSGMRQDAAQTAQNPQGTGAKSEPEISEEDLDKAKKTSDDYKEEVVDAIDDPFEKKRQEIADKFDAYAEAQKTIAAASSDSNAEAIRAANVFSAQLQAAQDVQRVNFEERLDGISKIGSGRTEARRDLGWAQARNAAANMALAKATSGRFTAEEKQEAFDKKRAADRSVADAEKELRAAKLSKDATRIKAAEDKLADARDLADAETTNYASFDVETARGLVRQTANEVKGFAFEASHENADAAYARFIAANEALDDAYASGDEKQIEAAEEEVANSQADLETANADLAAIVEGAQAGRAQLASSGSFNAFEAAGLGSNDWEKTEMEKQSAYLQRIADAAEKAANADDEGDDDAI
ncbi:MAG: phage tail tape measure protein [Thermoguttaceae bacterium]|nr:phage tail tape measure protein [Thermoguttaceae bacterium]MBQ8362304.1 phage tail tape measure protein [Thermoguttaceae bacterium]